VTRLRQRMLHELERRNYSLSTIQRYLLQEKKLAPSTVEMRIVAGSTSEVATHRSQNASLQICPYEIDKVFGQFDRRSRSLFRREQVKPYVVFEDFGHQTVDAAANVRQQHKDIRAIVASGE
jgi:hypothetical protein